MGIPGVFVKRFWGISALLLGLAPACLAAPTDIVPRGDTLNDAMAMLAERGLLTSSVLPVQFLGEQLNTREDLARILEDDLLDDQTRLADAEADSTAAAALRDALLALRPELLADSVDVDGILGDTRANTIGVGGYLQPEERLTTGGQNSPGDGTFGVYRATVLGDTGSHLRYVLSASNWAQDWRQKFTNDVGPHDFNGLNEGYLEYDAPHGLTIRLGQFYEHWGPGYAGATMLSDNAPPVPQAEITFPFSLGSVLGRNYHYSQLATAYGFQGRTVYMSARRLEYDFNSRLNADFQEDFLSDSARSLQLIPLPDFYSSENYNILGLRNSGFDHKFNANFNFGVAYSAGPALRVYGQFLVDDLQSPGHRTYTTPRKIAYLLGAAYRPDAQTQIVAEYTFADPTTYSNLNPTIQMQHGLYNYLGLPSGPNARGLFLRASRQVNSRLAVAAEGRFRNRHDNSFPEPNTQTLDASVTYSLNARNSLRATYYDYIESQFPIGSNVPLGNGFQPTQEEGDYGENQRIHELDMSYQFFF
jgi:hypothetical protein